MRKGAAGSVCEILSSAIRVTSTFADVAYSKASDSSGAFFLCLSLLITYHKLWWECKSNLPSCPQHVEKEAVQPDLLFSTYRILFQLCKVTMQNPTRHLASLPKCILLGYKSQKVYIYFSV